MTFELDHLIRCVPNLSQNPFDLDSVEGGRHPGHGTANRIIPLGDAYLEIVAVVDVEEASQSPYGRWVAEHATDDHINAICLRTDDIDAFDSTPMSRLRPDGVQISWRLAGLEAALSDGVPFFIQWDDMDNHPANNDLNASARIAEVTVSGDRQGLLSMTGPVDRLTYVDGPPGIDFTIAGS